MDSSAKSNVDDPGPAFAGVTAGNDAYVGNRIINSPGARIGPEGLNEEATTRLFELLLSRKEDQEYARSFIDYLSALRSFGQPTYQTLALRFPEKICSLDEVYVPVRASRTDESSQSVVFSEGMKVALGAGNHALLLEGEPGSGKSTVIRQIARHAWNEPERIGLDRRYIALPLRLRSLAISKSSSLEDRILQALDDANDLLLTGCRPPAGFFAKWPDQVDTPWLLLLDGFDEVPAAHRAEILLLLKRMIDAQTPLLLTSRPNSGISDELLRSVRSYVIDPFSAEQQHRLAEIWLGSKAGEFERAFEKIAGGDLGRTPLLLTIAAITYQSSHELPRRRSELYRVFVTDLWQEAWRRGRADQLGSELSELAPAIIPLCLKRIARTMTEQHGQSAALDFGANPSDQVRLIRDVLTAEMQLPATVAQFRAERVLEFLGRGSGVFTSTRTRCEWMHPTFREYLAAEDIVGRGGDEIRDTLLKFRESAWRQVGLFIVSILSEAGSVSDVLDPLSRLPGPHGAAFVATAIAEGADVNEELKRRTLIALCDDICCNSVVGYCERFLLPGNGGSAARKAFTLLKGHLPPDIADLLATNLIKIAVDYKRSGSSVVVDLVELDMLDVLDRLASDLHVPIEVRLDAARKQFVSNQPHRERGRNNILAAVEACAVTDWKAIAPLLATTNDPELIAEVVLHQKSIGPEQWVLLLDSLDSEIARAINEKLFSIEALPSDFRSLVHCRLVEDDDPGLVDLLASPTAEVVKASISALTRTQNVGRLVETVVNCRLRPRPRRLAIDALLKIGRSDEVRTVVENAGNSKWLRRVAAEALYRHAPMEVSTAHVLRDYFDTIAQQSRNLQTLEYRAFLHYITADHACALELLDQLASEQSLNCWHWQVRGHCLQSLGDLASAENAYEKAIAIDPQCSFALAQRAMICSEQGRFDQSLADIEQLGIYSAPNWFLKFAGDVLRKVGRVDQADVWLDRAMAVEPEEKSYINITRAEIEFDRGYFGLAIGFLRETLQESPSNTFARALLAKILRVAGQFEQSVEQYTELLSGNPTHSQWIAARAQGLMRLGELELARNDIQSMPSDDQDWKDYLGALWHAFARDEAGFAQRIEQLVRSKVFSNTEDVSDRANRVVLLAASGNAKLAESLLKELMEAKKFDILSYDTIAELDDLAAALPDAVKIAALCKGTREALWPEGCGLHCEPDVRLQALKGLQRSPYPFPMYCQKHAIEGLDQDQELASHVLIQAGQEVKTIVLWRIEASRLYGQCTFSQDLNVDNPLKFCDELETIKANLPCLIQDYGARRLVFLEKDLFEQLSSYVGSRRLNVGCVMASPLWIPRSSAGNTVLR